MEPLGNILLCGFLEKKRIWELSYYVVSYFKCCDRPVRFFPLFHGGGCPAEHQRQFAGIGAESDFTGCDRRMETHEKQYRAPLAATILNTVANTGGSVVASAAFIKVFGEKWLWTFSLGMTVAILFGTEILPKIIGVGYCRFIAPLLTAPLEYATKILHPVILLTEWFTKPFKAEIRRIAGDKRRYPGRLHPWRAPEKRSAWSRRTSS